MYRYIIIFALAFMSVGFAPEKAVSKGITFFKGSWTEALFEAKNADKYIFVDVYAKWCGPCKQLKRVTFKDKAVGDYYNKNFINVTMNGETEEGVAFLRAYGITSYPTLLIVRSDGKIMARAEGFMKPYILINFGRRVVPL